jgi:lysophospholipase L1-like esterase
MAMNRPTARKMWRQRLLLALLAWCHATQAEPEQARYFISAPSVNALQCPSQKSVGRSGSQASFSDTATTEMQMPPRNQLGALTQTVIRDRPVLDPRAISGFTLPAEDMPPRHIAVWGDSHISAGPFMPMLLQALRAQDVSTGTYFLPPTMGRANIRLPTLRASCVGPGWDTELAYIAQNTLPSGPALINRTAEAGSESYLWLDLRDADGRAVVRQLRIVYRASADGALDLVVNDGPVIYAALKAGGNQSQTLALKGDAPISTIKLNVSQGRFTLYGFILDYVDPPALTFDIFGIPSSTVRGWANADPGSLQQALHGVNYDGVILQYGTNEGNTLNFDRAQYAALLTEALTRMRQVFPNASCILVGPPDRGVLQQHHRNTSRGRHARADLLAFGRIHQQIAAIQSEVGERFGCVAWDWQSLMGGPGGSYGWFYARPSLMNSDLTHLSPAGYQQTGQALARSLGWQ